LKKFLCLFLIIIFTFASGIYAADEKPIMVQLNGNFIDFEVQPVMINYTLMAPLRTLAEKMGASISYNIDTDQITAAKGDITLTLKIGETSAEIKNKDDVQTVDIYTAPIISEDKAMVPLRFFAQTMGLDVGWDYDKNTAVLIDYSVFAKQIIEENSNLSKVISMIKVKGNYKDTITQNLEINANSETFGININASSNVNAELKVDGNRKSAEINTLNGGFFNLYTFILQAYQQGYDDEESIITPDFDKPINMKFMMNDNAAYIKSDLIIGAMLKGYPYNYLDKDYVNAAKDKWYKQSIDVQNNIVINYDEMDAGKKIETILKGITYNYGYYSNSIYYYNTFKNIIKKLMGDDKLTLISNIDGTYQASLKIDDKSIFDIITETVNSIYTDDKEDVMKNVNDYSDVCHFNINITAGIKEGIILNSAVDAAYKMDNIPNQFKIQIGTIEAKYSFTSAASDIGNVKIADSDFPADSNLLDEEQLKKDALQAKIKHFKDLGYEIDENGIVDYSKRYHYEEYADI